MALGIGSSLLGVLLIYIIGSAIGADLAVPRDAPIRRRP
jgi:hypothetical protein